MYNIVHLGKYYFPDAGGIESVTSSLAKGAAKFGHRVTVVCFKKTMSRDEETIEGVKVLRAPSTRKVASQPLGWTYIVRCLREARKADIVHLHTPNMLAAFGCLLIGKKPRLLVHWHSDVVGKGLLGWILKPLESALLKRAETIIATSEAYADASATLKPYYSKLQVVPIGVPDPRKSVLNAHNKKLPIKLDSVLEGKQLILAIGRLVPYKGFDVLIQAAKHMDDETVIVIVGSGPLQKPLEAAIKNTSVNRRVYLAGRLSTEAIQTLFSRAKLFCLPSIERSEAFGVVLLEAMANSLPIVATNIPGSGVPWVNQQDVSGLNVPVGDPVALAEACHAILNSPTDHFRLSQGARKRYESEFTEKVSVQRVMTIYEQMMTGRLHPSPDTRAIAINVNSL